MKEKILDALKDFNKNQELRKVVYESATELTGRNQFLFFIKPELTIENQGINFKGILEEILGKVSEAGLQIQSVNILSAQYLEKYNIIAQHYGVINKIASSGPQAISEQAKEKFREIYGKDINETKCVGGIEFLSENKELNAFSLDYIWQNLSNVKLGGGTYCELIKIDGIESYVLNGFHPRQLKHFIEKGRSIITFTLIGDTTWKFARQNLIGATNPAKANVGSIRRFLFDNKDILGLNEISQGMNGVHLSAGPIEALVELQRYNSNFSVSNGVLESESFQFGKALSKQFQKDFELITNNATITHEGKEISIFDLTEEMDSDQALEVLKGYFN